jgi:hypothetical protein
MLSTPISNEQISMPFHPGTGHIPPDKKLHCMKIAELPIREACTLCDKESVGLPRAVLDASEYPRNVRYEMEPHNAVHLSNVLLFKKASGQHFTATTKLAASPLAYSYQTNAFASFSDICSQTPSMHPKITCCEIMHRVLILSEVSLPYCAFNGSPLCTC